MINRQDTLTKLWHSTVRRMWYGTLGDDLDFVASIDTIAYENMLTADSMEFDMDMGRDLWLNKVRWTNLVRQYLEPGETARFLQRAGEIGVGEGKRGVTTTMFCKNVTREAKKHRWGNCMTSFVYRGLRTDQPTLSLHSRVSYIAYIGGLDLGLAYVLAKEIGRRIDVPVSEFRFVWYVDALQFHGFKSLPFLYRKRYVSDLNDTKGMRDQFPTIKLVGRWWDQIVADAEESVPLTQQKYGPLRRVRRRYEEWARGDFLPLVPVDSLSLAPLTRR